MLRRHPLRRGGAWAAIGAAAFVAGCSTIFDTPSLEGARSSIPDQILGDIAEQAKTEVPALATTPGEILTDVALEESRRAVAAASEHMGVTRDALTPPASAHARSRELTAHRPPTLAVERTGGAAAQFVLEGVRDGEVRLNGERIGLIQAQSSRIFVLAPGRHSVRVDYVGRPPFSAEFFIDKGERITLREAI